MAHWNLSDLHEMDALAIQVLGIAKDYITANKITEFKEIDFEELQENIYKSAQLQNSLLIWWIKSGLQRIFENGWDDYVRYMNNYTKITLKFSTC